MRMGRNVRHVYQGISRTFQTFGDFGGWSSLGSPARGRMFTMFVMRAWGKDHPLIYFSPVYSLLRMSEVNLVNIGLWRVTGQEIPPPRGIDSHDVARY